MFTLSLYNGISIHALLAESDFERLLKRTGDDDISIHALLAESDRNPSLAFLELLISIHALLAESDIPGRQARQMHANFYPRSPCGERLNDIKGMLKN